MKTKKRTSRKPTLFEIGPSRKSHSAILFSKLPKRKEVVVPVEDPNRPLQVGDAVKIRLQGTGLDFENVYVEVTQTTPRKVQGIIRDHIWFPRQHGFHEGAEVKFDRNEILKIERSPKIMSGQVYPRKER